MPDYSTVVQYGIESAGGFWSTGIDDVGNNNHMAFSIDFSGALSDGVNRPVFGTSFTLNVNWRAAPISPMGIPEERDFGGLYFVNELNPPLFSNSHKPSTLIANGTAVRLLEFDAGDVVAGDNLHSQVETGPTSTDPVGRLRGLISNVSLPAIQFIIGPVLRIVGGSSPGDVIYNPATLIFSTAESRFHTGHAVGGMGKRGRARHCARSGLPANTADLIPDGYLEGSYHVLPDWWEPEDRSGLDIIIPPNEGEIDDAVTGDS